MPSTAAAADRPALAVGDRVRLQTIEGRVTGALVSAEDGMFVVQQPELTIPTTIDRRTVLMLDVARRQSGLMRGAALGALFGGLGGSALGSLGNGLADF